MCLFFLFSAIAWESESDSDELIEISAITPTPDIAREPIKIDCDVQYCRTVTWLVNAPEISHNLFLLVPFGCVDRQRLDGLHAHRGRRRKSCVVLFGSKISITDGHRDFAGEV